MPTLVELDESFSINRQLRPTYKTSKLLAPSKDGMVPLIPQFLKLLHMPTAEVGENNEDDSP
jgi:hypothetical protein